MPFIQSTRSQSNGERGRCYTDTVGDGFTFAFEGIEILSQPHMEYSGYRTTLKVSLAKMKDKIHVDVGIGDIVEPQHKEIKLFEYRGKPFFEKSISLLVYPIETIFAEKLETILSKGSRNSRMKDFHDLFYFCVIKACKALQSYMKMFKKHLSIAEQN